MRAPQFFCILILLFVASPFVSYPVKAQETSLPPIEVGIGEKKILPIEGFGFFPSDETIITVEDVPPNRVAVTGLRGGTTQILYWQGETLHTVNVQVTIPLLFTGATGTTPRFKGDRLYFIYEMQNFSGFSDKNFYTTPSYNHNLVGKFPLGKGHVSTLTSFRQAGDGTNSLQRGQVTYFDLHRFLQFGETTGTTSRFGIFNSTSLLGGLLRFNQSPKSDPHVAHEFNLFGGSSLPSNLLDTEAKDPLSGANYSYTRYLPKKITPDFANASAFSYQPKGENTIAIGGVAEGNYHLGKDFSLGSGFARGEGGYVATFHPVFEKERGLVTAFYTYLNHGLKEINETAKENDEHTADLNAQWLLKDDKTILSGNVDHSMSLPKGTSDEPSITLTSGNFSVARRLALRKSYGLGYSVGRSITDGVSTLVNGIAGNMIYPVSRTSRLTHQLQYSRTDWSNSSNLIGFSTAFDFEKSRIAYNSTLSAAVTEGETTDSESLSLDQTLEWVIKNGVLDLGVTYTKPTLRDSSTHQFILTQLFNYPITSTQWFALSSAFSLQKSAGSLTNNGTFGIVYRRYFGPGVASDPLWKKILKGEKKSAIDGDLFLDKNYNSFLDEEDAPLSGAVIIVDDRFKTTTDTKGHFILKMIKEGEHKLRVDTTGLSLPSPDIRIPLQTFTSNGRDTLTLPIPLTIPKATLRVQFLLDTNDNGKADESDGIALILRTFITLPSGEKRTISVRGQGGTLVQGIDKGKVLVSIDPIDVPESIQALDNPEKEIKVTDYQEYVVNFLFRPIRGIQGKIRMPDQSPLPKNMVVELGKASSKVDEKGYFWLKDLKPGTYNFKIRGLPQDYCVEPHISQILIPEESLTATLELPLTNQCPP